MRTTEDTISFGRTSEGLCSLRRSAFGLWVSVLLTIISPVAATAQSVVQGSTYLGLPDQPDKTVGSNWEMPILSGGCLFDLAGQFTKTRPYVQLLAPVKTGKQDILLGMAYAESFRLSGQDSKTSGYTALGGGAYLHAFNNSLQAGPVITFSTSKMDNSPSLSRWNAGGLMLSRVSRKSIADFSVNFLPATTSGASRNTTPDFAMSAGYSYEFSYPAVLRLAALYYTSHNNMSDTLYVPGAQAQLLSADGRFMAQYTASSNPNNTVHSIGVNFNTAFSLEKLWEGSSPFEAPNRTLPTNLDMITVYMGIVIVSLVYGIAAMTSSAEGATSVPGATTVGSETFFSCGTEGAPCGTSGAGPCCPGFACASIGPPDKFGIATSICTIK